MILRNNLSIFEAKLQDVDSLIELLKILFSIEKDFVFDKDKHFNGLKLLIESNISKVIVVKFEGEIIGMVTLQTIISTANGSKSGLIEDFVIKEDFRDMGVGTYLFEYIKKLAKETELERLQLVCDEDNEAAKEFYRNKKFNPSNLKAWYYFPKN